MSDVFEEYKTFPTFKQAQEYIEALDKIDIKYKLENVTPLFDPSFAGNTNNEAVILMIKKNDFWKADKAFEVEHLIDIASIDKSYYLFTFSDTELMDVIVKKDEWNNFDYILAQKLLKERGKEISSEMLDTLRRQRQQEMSRHLPFPKTWVIAGYIFALLGGLVSIFIGLQILWDTKKLPDGTTMNSYDSQARFHGQMIFTIGLIVLIITIMLNSIEEYYNIFNR
jgi:hypothetical protein